MELHWIYFVVLFGLVLSEEEEDDDGCPPAQDILPCTCDAEGVNCMWANSLSEIEKAFKTKFPYNATRAVYVQATPIKSLTADLFGKTKAESFFIELNEELETVDLKAFSASKTTLKTLSLYGNKIVEFPFKDITYFENLDFLSLANNQIEVIPDNAISSRSLYSIILAQNKIKQLGSNAFINCQSVGRLELADNEISNLGPMSLAMKRHQKQLAINLGNNLISDIDSKAFGDSVPYYIRITNNQLTHLKEDPFKALIQKLNEINGALQVSGNPFSCKGCEYSWLVQNKEWLKNRLFGFSCEDERGLNDIEESNIECN